MSLNSSTSVPDSTPPDSQSETANALVKPPASEPQSRRQRLAVGGLCVVAFLFFYVALAGPVAAIHRKVKAEPVRVVIEVAFAPLVFLVKHDVKPFSPMIKWYFGLWR
ncbi:MAG: hypothetical protein O3A00_12575 [Planctomycetota bacterium]|nr:hypothetical protein [Planctomycetota bacterium]